MGVSISFRETQIVKVFEEDMTHNVAGMAKAAGLYEAIWHPYRFSDQSPGAMAERLREGLAKLKADEATIRPLEPSNGWGTYDDFVEFVERLIRVCETFPNAEVTAVS
jgi:hypothetical protein